MITADNNLIAAQRSLWLGQKLAPDSPLYNMAFLFTLSDGSSGELDAVHFKAAFSAVVQRCDALRMVITEQAGDPQRQVLEQIDESVLVLNYCDREDPYAAAQAWAKERTQQPFNLSAKLFDTALIQLGNGKTAWYINQHHLITDIESVKRLYITVSDFYRRSVEGTLASAPALPSYAEVSFPAPTARATNYWKQQKALPVAIYHRMAAQVPSRTRRVTCELGEQRTKALRQLALNSSANALTPQMSLFNVVAGLFLAYLHRVSGQAEVAIATPVHGRPTAALKETIGVFVELFPLLAEIEPTETFSSLFGEVNTAGGGLLRYAQPGASEFAPNKAINVVLNFIGTQLPAFDDRSVRSEWIHSGEGDPRHHLRLQVHDFDRRGSLQLHFDFNEELFEPGLQARAPGHFLTLVDAAIADSGQPISHIALVTDSEQNRLLSIGRHPVGQDSVAAAKTTLKTVVQQLETRAAQVPDNIALVLKTNNNPDQTLTYRQLNARANQLAHYLKSQGVTTESSVGLCFRRSVEMLIAIWGVLKASGTYVPIDPSHPAERISHIIRDTQVLWILTHSTLIKQLNSLTTNAAQTSVTTKILTIDQLNLQEQSENNLPKLSELSQLAYVLYTSGSTGNPKGVEIEHQGLANYVQWAKQQYVKERTLAFPLFSPLTFDLTVTSIFVPLLSGGQVVIYPEGDEPIDLSLRRIFQDNAVDVIKLTPSHLALVKGMALGSRVKTLILGGEDLKTALASEIASASASDIEIYNEYGPTETTVGCMIHRFDPSLDQSASVPIGQPAAGSNIYLLDEHLNLVPQGTVGEIYIGGPGLARGYLNQYELTRAKFIQWNRTEQPSEDAQRLYRTGDLGQWQENGVLSYLGRRDRQVKIRGNRIELGEIEAALLTHPDISGVALNVVQPARPQKKSKTVFNPSPSLSYCTRCGLASNYPGVSFNAAGVCDVCLTYETYRHRTEQYFKPWEKLRSHLKTLSQRKRGEYDCMMLLSGGKDSTYALAQLVHMGLKVFAFTLDNGYISEQAKDNIRRVVQALGVDHHFGTTPAMNEIFVDSLERHCNVCNGCFKTIYTLSMKLAYERGIPCIVTGLSRGQFFETRLSEEWFTELFGQPRFEVEQIDETVLAARKAYHRTEDAVSQLMDVDMFKSDDIFEAVEIVDFYRYCEVELEEMLAFLRDRLPWIRPSDTGRSTNCLINNVGIYLHTQQRGYHNYALPYSWDVRMGHKTVDDCIDELNDEIDVTEVENILREIGYQGTRTTESQLAAYYVSSTEATAKLLPSDLRTFLAQRLPQALIPAYLVSIDHLPLTPNGKVDFSALPNPKTSRFKDGSTANQSPFVAPTTTAEQTLSQLWQQVLQTNNISVHDNFFDLGGDSIMAIQIAARMADAGFMLSPNQMFQHPTLAELAIVATPEKLVTAEDLSGLVPLTPIQQAFFEQQSPDPQQFTQTLQLRVKQPLEIEFLRQAIARLVEHHDSLRLSYQQVATVSGTVWEQRYQEGPHPKSLSRRALLFSQSGERDFKSDSLLPSGEGLGMRALELQSDLTLSTGDLVRAALFNLETGEQHLVMVIHHLAVDAVSWTTLLKDLESIYQQIANSQKPVLPLKTSSFKAWAEGLRQYPISPSEIDYWLSPAPTPLARLTDSANSKCQTEASAQSLSFSLSTEITQQLRQSAHRDRPQEILLAALILAINAHTDSANVRIDLEGHGREETIVPDVRLVKTVGWFTSLFPVTLTAKTTPTATLQSVKSTLRDVPQSGIGYGLLRYWGEPPIRAQLKAQPPAEILFNYLGELEQLLPSSSLFELAQPLTVSRSPQQIRSHPLDISAFIYQGQLHIDWRYSNLPASTVQTLAASVTQQIADLLKQPAKPAVAEDFPLAKLNPQKLDKLSALLNKTDRLGGLS